MCTTHGHYCFQFQQQLAKVHVVKWSHDAEPERTPAARCQEPPLQETSVFRSVLNKVGILN